MKRALIVNHAGLYWPTAMVRAVQYDPHFRRSPDWTAAFTTRRSEALLRFELSRSRPLRLALKPFRRVLPFCARVWERRQEDVIVDLARSAVPIR
jgi:hypothetical protein